MRILFTASEVAPFRQTGGLADVAAALPAALAARGHDVRVVMPLYQGIRWDDLDRVELPLRVPRAGGDGYAGVRLGRLPCDAEGGGVPVYLLEHHGYYDRPFMYGPPDGSYGDNLERYAFLCRGALELCKALSWTPDVCHANDWQTALLPAYLNTVERGGPLAGAASVFTIHNLAFQGVTHPAEFGVTGLGPEHFTSAEFEHFGALNPVKAAIAHATALSTVSPGYRREIQTPEFGCGLDGPLRDRAADLHGILNGIDTAAWDPARDPYLPARYSARDLVGKAACKWHLQLELGLPPRSGVPLLAVISRLAGQKGLDVLAAALDRILARDVQLVVLGTGDRDLEAAFRAAQDRHPGKMRAIIGFDVALAHRIEAAADLFLMPSRFEPCGLNQLYSMRYGTLPVVHAVGGLADTVQNFSPDTGEGTGFVFWELSAGALADTIDWALWVLATQPGAVNAMRAQGMTSDFSWDGAARRYEDLYAVACARRAAELAGGHGQ
jgi:starch synthase